MDLAPFRRINPCGYQGLEMTRISDLATPAPTMAAVEAVLLDQLVGTLGYRDHHPIDNPLAILAEPAHD